jgi:hypothetical protein
MAYHESVPVIEGDIAVVQASQTSLEHSDSPRVFQFNNQEPHIIAKEYMGNSVGSASTNALAYSPDGRYLVWCISQRVIIYDLDTGNVRDTPTGVIPVNPVFTGDSNTVLFATNSAPFIIAIDLYTGATRGTIEGTYTFTNGMMKGCGYQNKCYLINSGAVTTAGTYPLYEYNGTTNSITTLTTASYNYGWIACSVSGKIMVAVSGASTATGPLTYLYNLDDMSEAPYTVGTSTWRGGTGLSAMCRWGSSGQNFMMLLGLNNVSPRLINIFRGATLADSTMKTITASGQGSITSSQPTGLDNFGFVYHGYLSTYPVYNANAPVCFLNLRAYAGTGSVTSTILPGVNEKYGAIAISPRFTVRRLAGVVKGESGGGIARKVVVINRRTMRMIAQTTSSSYDGSFTIPIYNGEQCIVMAVGTGTYSSKLVDYVAPVV